ncbi:MAG: hypothetical protein NTV22_00630 [bacterium]|nr:hypothetical protein [bacterium]
MKTVFWYLGICLAVLLTMPLGRVHATTLIGGGNEEALREYHCAFEGKEYKKKCGKAPTLQNLLQSIATTNTTVAGEAGQALGVLCFTKLVPAQTNAVVGTLRLRAERELSSLKPHAILSLYKMCARQLLDVESGVPHGVRYLRMIVTNPLASISFRMNAAIPLVRHGVLDGYELLPAALNSTNYAVRGTAERLLCAYAPYDGARAGSGATVDIKKLLAGITTPAAMVARPKSELRSVQSVPWWFSLPYDDKLLFDYPVTRSDRLLQQSNDVTSILMRITAWSNKYGYVPAATTNALDISRKKILQIMNELPLMRTNYY